MIFKYKNYYLEPYSQDYDQSYKIFLQNKENLKKIKKAFDKIELVYITHELIKENKAIIPSYINVLTEDEVIEKVFNKKYRYSEAKNNARFMFYENILNEFRYLTTGGSNFFVIKSIYDTAPYYSDWYDLDDIDDLDII